MARQFGWICLAFGLFMMMAQTSQAQLRIGQYLPQRPLRFLGHGNGPGNHYYNPGPDVSYYNSWTQKNSFLISRSPQYLNRFGNEPPRTPMYLLYSGHSPYGPAAQPTPQFGGSVPLNADFVPTTPTTPTTPAKDDLDKDDDFGDDDSDIEDRFEEDADAIDDEPGDFGGFELLDEKGSGTKTKVPKTTENKGAALSYPSVFLPASRPVHGVRK